MDVAAKRDALKERKFYAPVKGTKEKNVNTAGLKNVRNSREWKQDGSCARNHDENHN